MAAAMNENDLVKISTPETWQQMSSEMLLYPLSLVSEECKVLTKQINKTLKVQVKSVMRVQNPYLWGSYQLKKLEYARNGPVREIQMFHCTAMSNINSIATDNFDWRRCIRSKFGQGVSFSPSAEYADKYANSAIGTERALVLTTVLVGREIQGRQGMTIPPKSYDTSFGNRNFQGAMVNVKYCDHEFYPLYVAYYTSLANPHRRSRFRNNNFDYEGFYEDLRENHDDFDYEGFYDDLRENHDDFDYDGFYQDLRDDHGDFDYDFD